MRNRVKYFITDCSTSCMSVLLSATRFGISLWHYSFRSYKMCYYTSSHIWTYVTPCPPLRPRFPTKIAARWRYRPPIKNMTAHYNSQVCVSFHCCFLQEAQKSLWTCLNGTKNNVVHFKSVLECCLINSWSSSQHLHAGKRWRVIPSLPSDLVFHFTLVKWFRFGWPDWLGEILALLVNKLTNLEFIVTPSVDRYLQLLLAAHMEHTF